MITSLNYLLLSLIMFQSFLEHIAIYQRFFSISARVLMLDELTKSHLTQWGRVTHICVSDLTIIGSDNGFSPGRRQAIIWTNAGILFNRNLRNKLLWNFNRNSDIFRQENDFQSVVCEIVTILSRPVLKGLVEPRLPPLCSGRKYLYNWQTADIGPWHWTGRNYLKPSQPTCENSVYVKYLVICLICGYDR